jgi:hypothetical protein
MAKILTSEEWKRQEFKQKNYTPDVGRLANWFFTKAIYNGHHSNKLAALQTIWAVAPECFSISPIHSGDNHFSIRITYIQGTFETIHLYVIPNTNVIHSASFKNGAEFATLWQNLRI